MTPAATREVVRAYYRAWADRDEAAAGARMTPGMRHVVSVSGDPNDLNDLPLS